MLIDNDDNRLMILVQTSSGVRSPVPARLCIGSCGTGVAIPCTAACRAGGGKIYDHGGGAAARAVTAKTERRVQ